MSKKKYKEFEITTKDMKSEGWVWRIWQGEGEGLTCVMDSGDFFGSSKEAMKDAQNFIDKNL